MKTCVMGAGGFIGHHLCTKLVELGHEVVGVDIKEPQFEASKAQEFIIGDLRDINIVEKAIKGWSRFFSWQQIWEVLDIFSQVKMILL